VALAIERVRTKAPIDRLLVVGRFKRDLGAWRRDPIISRPYGIFIRLLPVDARIVFSSHIATRRRDAGRVRIAALADQDIAPRMGDVGVRSPRDRVRVNAWCWPWICLRCCL